MRRIVGMTTRALAAIPLAASAQVSPSATLPALIEPIELHGPVPLSLPTGAPTLPSQLPLEADPLDASQQTLLTVDLADWFQKRDQILIPLDPELTAHTLTVRAQEYAQRCVRAGSLYCVRAEGFAKAARSLAAASGLSPDCDIAATGFITGYASGAPEPAVARAFDLACLGSFTPRLAPAGTPVDAPRPSLLADAAGAGGVLSAVGLLESGGSIRCAGLVRPDDTFLTARHCVQHVDPAGFRVLSTSGKVLGSRLAVSEAPSWSATDVPADRAVIALPPGAGAAAAPTHLVRLLAPAEVTLVAPYPHAADTRYARPDPLPLRALRYPRAGMCQALLAYAGCLQLVCQTVRGFSGAPIFSERRADGSYEVVGFVSGSEGKDVKCTGTEAIANSTLAVSAEMFGS